MWHNKIYLLSVVFCLWLIWGGGHLNALLLRIAQSSFPDFPGFSMVNWEIRLPAKLMAR